MCPIHTCPGATWHTRATILTEPQDGIGEHRRGFPRLTALRRATWEDGGQVYTTNLTGSLSTWIALARGTRAPAPVPSLFRDFSKLSLVDAQINTGKHPMPTQTATHKMCVLPLSLVLLSALALPTMLIAQEKSPDTVRDLQALVHALQKGGHIIYLRHTATDHSRIDSDREDLNNCERQRNLSEEGREQARLIGKAFTALGIKVAKVLTSPYCRCIDTGRLAFGEATVEEGLSFTISKDEAETKRLAALLRKLLGTQPPEGANIVLVSHSGNLKEATGIWPESEGVIHIFQPHADGGFVYIGKVLPDKWGDLVRSR